MSGSEVLKVPEGSGDLETLSFWRVFKAFAVSRALEGSGRFQTVLEVSLKGPEVPEGFSSVWQVLESAAVFKMHIIHGISSKVLRMGWRLTGRDTI